MGRAGVMGGRAMDCALIESAVCLLVDKEENIFYFGNQGGLTYFQE